MNDEHQGRCDMCMYSMLVNSQLKCFAFNGERGTVDTHPYSQCEQFYPDPMKLDNYRRAIEYADRVFPRDPDDHPVEGE